MRADMCVSPLPFREVAEELHQVFLISFHFAQVWLPDLVVEGDLASNDLMHRGNPFFQALNVRQHVRVDRLIKRMDQGGQN